jgi:hypothetical protein
MPLRACPTIWFSSLGWPIGEASRRLAFPVSYGRAGKRCAAASLLNDRLLGSQAPPQVAVWSVF